MKKYKKEITFDLDTNELKKLFGVKNYGKGYRQLRRVLEKENAFEHRQGSVYCSFKVISFFELCKVMLKLKKQCPWLKTALTRMDTSNVGLIHEVTKILKF